MAAVRRSPPAAAPPDAPGVSASSRTPAVPARPRTHAERPAGVRRGGTLRLGVRYIDARSVAAAAQLFGLSGASVGDPPAYARALIADINRGGGVLGRRIEPTFHGVDAVQLAVNSAAAEEEACRALSEDADVFAVVSPGPTNQAFTDCMSRRKIPVVNASYNYFTPSLLRRYRPYFYFPAGMDASRSARAFVDGLRAQGFFARGHRLGVVRLDSDVHANVLEESVEPALRARGYRIHERYAVANGQDSAGFSSAVLRFKAAGITNVLFIESAGQLALGFTDAAENQAYRPRYGFSSHASLSGVAANTPPVQLARSAGIGWVRASDATGPNGVELSRAGSACRSTIRRSGAEIADNGALTIALWTCDTFRFLDTALELGGALSVGGLRDGAGRIGSSFETASTFGAAFPSGRPDGATTVRELAYVPGCSCFRWSGAPYRP